MPEYIVFPDVELALITYLTPLVGVPVVDRVPEDRPAAFVRVELTGGTEPSVAVEEVDVEIEAWAADNAAASVLAQRTRAAIRQIGSVGAVHFYRPRVYSTPARLPDPTTNQARYTALYALRVRGTGTNTL